MLKLTNLDYQWLGRCLRDDQKVLDLSNSSVVEGKCRATSWTMRKVLQTLKIIEGQQTNIMKKQRMWLDWGVFSRSGKTIWRVCGLTFLEQTSPKLCICCTKYRQPTEILKRHRYILNIANLLANMADLVAVAYPSNLAEMCLANLHGQVKTKHKQSQPKYPQNQQPYSSTTCWIVLAKYTYMHDQFCKHQSELDENNWSRQTLVNSVFFVFAKNLWPLFPLLCSQFGNARFSIISKKQKSTSNTTTRNWSMALAGPLQRKMPSMKSAQVISPWPEDSWVGPRVCMGMSCHGSIIGFLRFMKFITWVYQMVFIRLEDVQRLNFQFHSFKKPKSWTVVFWGLIKVFMRFQSVSNKLFNHAMAHHVTVDFLRCVRFLLTMAILSVYLCQETIEIIMLNIMTENPPTPLCRCRAC